MKREFSIRDTQISRGIAVLLMFIHHLFVNPADWKGYEVRFFYHVR